MMLKDGRLGTVSSGVASGDLWRRNSVCDRASGEVVWISCGLYLTSVATGITAFFDCFASNVPTGTVRYAA